MNKLNRNRKSIRLKEYDYSQPGEYFVTICTLGKEFMFWEVVNEKMQLSTIGEIAQRCWMDIPGHFPNVSLDEYIIMPNHIHGIIVLNESVVGVEYIQPLQKTFQHVIPESLGSIIRSYKAAVTRGCRKCRRHDFYWQRNYFDRIIRNEKELQNVREYILNNPLNWWLDEENPYVNKVSSIA